MAFLSWTGVSMSACRYDILNRFGVLLAPYCGCHGDHISRDQGLAGTNNHGDLGNPAGAYNDQRITHSHIRP